MKNEYSYNYVQALQSYAIRDILGVALMIHMIFWYSSILFQAFTTKSVNVLNLALNVLFQLITQIS